MAFPFCAGGRLGGKYCCCMTARSSVLHLCCQRGAQGCPPGPHQLEVGAAASGSARWALRRRLANSVRASHSTRATCGAGGKSLRKCEKWHGMTLELMQLGPSRSLLWRTPRIRASPPLGVVSLLLSTRLSPSLTCFAGQEMWIGWVYRGELGVLP